MSVASRHQSPEDVARTLGVRDSKVYAWIQSGELRASNLAAVSGKRPRFRVSPEALADFLAARQVIPAPKKVVRRRREQVIEFF